MTSLPGKAHRVLMLCLGWGWLSVCDRVARQGRDGSVHGAVEADGVRPWCGPLPERGSKTITRDLACMSSPAVRAAQGTRNSDSQWGNPRRKGSSRKAAVSPPGPGSRHNLRGAWDERANTMSASMWSRCFASSASPQDGPWHHGDATAPRYAFAGAEVRLPSDQASAA